MKTTVSEKGQITIPKAVRDQLGIRPGQELAVEMDRGRVVLSKRIGASITDRVYGRLKLGKPTDEIMLELRGDRSDLLR